MKVRPPSSLADTSQEATDAAQAYSDALDACLSSHDWGFARELAVLPVISEPPPGWVTDPDLPGAFQLPNDFLKLQHVYSVGLAYRLDGSRIRAAQLTPLMVRYTARRTNEAAMPAAFRRYVSFEVANRLAPYWVGARTKREDIASGLSYWMDRAKSEEATNASPVRWDGRDDQGDWSDEATL